MNLTNFVNESRNVVWLSGYARGGDKDDLLLYQSSNEERAIPIRVASNLRRPRPNAPCEIKCHAFGYRDESGRNWIRLEAIQIKRASVTATPRRLVALNALRPRAALAAADYSPFISLERLKDEIRENLRLDAATVDSLLADASKRTSMKDGFQNKVILSGFVGHKAYIGPTDDGSGDLGHILFHLHQQTEADRALPLRVQGADARFSKELKALHPVAVIAEIRTLVEKNAEGEITTRKVYLTTDRNNVGFATVNEFARRAFPQWWLEAVRAHYEQRRDLAQNSRQLTAAAVKVASTPPPTLPVLDTGSAFPDEASAFPDGVQVSSDVF